MAILIHWLLVFIASFAIQVAALNPAREQITGLPALGHTHVCRAQVGDVSGYYRNPTTGQFGVLLRTDASVAVELYCEVYELR